MSYDERQWNSQKKTGFRGPAHLSRMPSHGRGNSNMPPPVPRNPQMGPPPYANFQHFPVDSRSNFGVPPQLQFSGFQNPPQPPASFSGPPFGFIAPQNHSVPVQHNPHLNPQNSGNVRGISPSLDMTPGMNYATPPPANNNMGTPVAVGQYQQMPGYVPFVPPPHFPVDHHQQSSGNFNSSSGLAHSDHPTGRESGKKVLDDKDIGAQQLDTWLRKVGKSKASQLKAPPKSKSHVQLWESISQLQDMTEIMKTMSAHMTEMASCVSSVNNATWESMTKNMEAMKKKYTDLEPLLEEPSVQTLEKKLMKTRQKRARLRQAAEFKYEEQQSLKQAWDQKSQQIDKWQQSHRAKIREENLRKSRKAAADRTLGKVTREIQDATRLIDTMLSLQKLRLIRRDAAQKRGDTDLGESRQTFEEKITDMTRLVQSQLECYKVEEANLKEVIKSEQEESTKKERLVQAEKEKQKQREEDEELETMLFGPQDEITEGDPLLPYVQFYRQAESSLEAFIQIRREWDSFLVPKNTPASSVIPSTWIVPEPPSSAVWASALK